MANDDYIDVEFDIFEYTGQRARVRKTLTVGVLIEEILREFDDIPSDPSNSYVLYLKGIEKSLDLDKTLMDLDIQPQDELVFDHYRTFLRRMLPEEWFAYFIEEKTGEIFEIQWQPALIGRSSTNMDHNFILAVNLQSLPDGKSVSRSHAQITFSGGKYYFERLAENNPASLNGKELAFGKKFEIKPGDKLSFVHNRIILIFSRQTLKSTHKETITEENRKSKNVEPPEAHTMIVNERSPLPVSETIPELVIETASGPDIAGQVILLEGFPVILGRNHPLLGYEKDISRSHAEITYDPQYKKYYIKDLNSTNGVAVDGNDLAPNMAYELIPGSRICLGKIVTMLFQA